MVTRLSESVPVFDTTATKTNEVSGEISNFQFNAFIYRLPTEPLEAIFIHCARDYYCRTSLHCTLPTAPSWVNVSYVNRRWRNVALNCPSLWGYLFVSSPRWTEELLARSKQASLKLQLYLRPHEWELHILEQVVNHVERIQELCIKLSERNANVLQSLLSLRAPRLRNLEISTTETRHSVFEWSSLFNGDTPALRTLELSGYVIPWRSSQLSGLRTLIVNKFPAGKDTAEFLAALGCMQHLTYLHLDCFLDCTADEFPSSTFHGRQKVHLPRLSRLCIVAPPVVLALLSCMNIPMTTKVKVDCAGGRDSSLDDYAPLRSLVAHKVGMSGDGTLYNQPVRLLAIAFVQRTVKLTFSTSERHYTDVFDRHSLDPIWDRDLPLQIVLHRPASVARTDWEDFMSHICCPAPLSTIQECHVFKPPASLAFWTHALGRLSGLRHLKLYEGYMPPLTSVLKRSPRDFVGPEDTCYYLGDEVFAPALERLGLRRITFVTDVKGRAGPPKRPESDVQALRKALSARKAPRVRLVTSECFEENEALMRCPLEQWEDFNTCSCPYDITLVSGF